LSIGPIIFRDLSQFGKSAKQKSYQVKTVTVFDVTPKMNAGKEAFYSDSVMINFIRDIRIAINSKYPSALIRLKPKRQYSSEDSFRYQEFLESHSSDLEILEWDSDIVAEILKSDLVVCIPYSSPALISKYLGVPTIFYSPTSDFNLEQTHEGVSVILGLNELQLFLANLT
jgi:polysaccharide biosynthesis PFTS motif protein